MKHLKIQVSGLVQGVGFRPFVHRLANQYRLNGYACNNAQGLVIHIQGKEDRFSLFLKDLKEKAPRLAYIQDIRTAFLPTEPINGFTIRESENGPHKTWISPDIAPCEDCLRELFDPEDRRFRYPFINCTNCGPRYSIVKDIPYDRNNTTMNSFELCSLCKAEYENIADRRYHAQPDACAACGPSLQYIGKQTGNDPLQNAVEDLKAGQIVAIKGVGGIHLACPAENEQAVLRLRHRKQREAKPLAVMVKDIDTAKTFADLTNAEIRTLCSPARPIVLCRKKESNAYSFLSENQLLGILLPYSPLHYLLMENMNALVMTSANLRDQPVLTDNEEALTKLSGIADSFLLHDRPIENRCDDSLIYLIRDEPRFIRRSRGYAPVPFFTREKLPELLALGAHQKGSFALSEDHTVFLSPYIGNMENQETVTHYQKTLRTYQRLFEIEPKAIACDLHPDYETTRIAQASGLLLLQVQHHHAHMASCMADNHLDEPCFGIIWDGAGLGDDGSLWGCECMIGDFDSFQRVGSIKEIPLIGHEQAIKEIGRIAWVLDPNTHLFDETKEKQLEQIRRFSIPSSGMGRLLDGIFSLLTRTVKADYDGQAPALLESLATETRRSYSLSFYEENRIRRFNWQPMIQEMVHDDSSLSEKAGKVYNTLIEMAIDQVNTLNTKHLPVVLSGGCFQSRLLTDQLIDRLQKQGYRVFFHHSVSTNDEGIALGQLMILQRRMSYVSGRTHDHQRNS